MSLMEQTDGGNQVRVFVNSAAGTGNTVLEEESRAAE
jgi:hypothetical protein